MITREERGGLIRIIKLNRRTGEGNVRVEAIVESGVGLEAIDQNSSEEIPRSKKDDILMQ